MQIAPWLHPTDILGALQAGSHVGLSARQADQRDAEMAQQAELAAAREQQQAQREQQNAQEAAAQLRYHYDALSQARDLALRDDVSKEEALKAARALKAGEDDALAKYRQGVLQNQTDRNNYLKGKPTEAKTYHVGDHLIQVDPSGGVKTLFSKPDDTKIPMVSGIPAIADDPASPKLRLRADDPLLNKLMGTNASMLGTNFVMPRIAPKAVVPAAPVTAPADTKFKKGMRAVQNGKTFEYDGDKWNRLDNLSEGDTPDPSADEIDTGDEPAADEEA